PSNSSLNSTTGSSAGRPLSSQVTYPLAENPDQWRQSILRSRWSNGTSDAIVTNSISCWGTSGFSACPHKSTKLSLKRELCQVLCQQSETQGWGTCVFLRLQYLSICARRHHRRRDCRLLPRPSLPGPNLPPPQTLRPLRRLDQTPRLHRG